MLAPGKTSAAAQVATSNSRVRTVRWLMPVGTHARGVRHARARSVAARAVAAGAAAAGAPVAGAAAARRARAVARGGGWRRDGGRGGGAVAVGDGRRLRRGSDRCAILAGAAAAGVLR